MSISTEDDQTGADTTIRCSPLVREPLPTAQIDDVSAVFKALADPVRLRLFNLIASHGGGEACVCDLAPHVDVAQPTVSHHLKVLKAAGLVESERRASWVYYRALPSVLTAATASITAPDTTADTTTESSR